MLIIVNIMENVHLERCHTQQHLGEEWPLCVPVSFKEPWPLCVSVLVKEALPWCVSVLLKKVWLLCVSGSVVFDCQFH